LRRMIIAPILIWLCLVGYSDCPSGSSSSPSPDNSWSMALIGAKIYPSPTATAIDDGVVLIQEGRIVGVGERAAIMIPADAAKMDCAGLIMTSAFWNSHVHFTEPKWQSAETQPAAHLRGAAHIERVVGIGGKQVLAFSNVGGQILFGTDVGCMQDYDPTDEYVLMHRAGLSFERILTSLTTAPAERFGVSQVTGRIAAGMDADMVLLAGDPAADIKDLAKVRYTIRQGTMIYQHQ
jgi:imidazolonepropionase-like amidohydrolase